MRFLDYLDRYGVDHDIRPGTLADYRVAAVVFVRNQGVDTFTLLRAADISEHLAWLARHDYSPATIRGRRAKLLVLWRAAYRDGYTDNRPDPDRVRKVRVPAPNPQGLSHDETAKLVEYCQENMRRRMRLIPVPAGDYLAALFLYLWATGCRIGDALAVRYDMLNGDTVTWRQQKTGTWHRARLSPATLHAVELIRTPGRCLVWPRPGKSRTALYAMIKRAFSGAGLTGTSKYIRRGVATDVFQRGLDPGRALGHVPGSRVAIRFYVSQDAQIDPVSPTEL